MKTNAARILDSLGIHYELRDYQIDESDLTAISVARKVGLPPEQVFKTLVCRGDKYGVCLAVVPGDAELDLKALARASGDNRQVLGCRLGLRSSRARSPAPPPGRGG